MASLATPLLLASSLLAVVAVAGFTGVVAAGRHRVAGARGVAVRVAVVGGLAYIAGQILQGAQLDPWGSDVAYWLQAGGLVTFALLVAPQQLTLPGHAILVPVAGLQPALVAAVAGSIAGLRLLLGGLETALAGVGLAALGFAPYVGRTDVTLGAFITATGALTLGLWLVRASRSSLLAKFVTAFVSAMLVLVVLVATVLSTVARSDLVADELDRLQAAATNLATDVERWPREGVAAATAFAQLRDPLLVPQPPEINENTYRLGFREQDFFMIVDAGSMIVNQHPSDLDSGFQLGLTGSEAVRGVLSAAASEAGGLISTGGRVVGFGVAPILSADPAVTQPIGALITGRFLDGDWAESSRLRLGLGIAAAVAGAEPVASEGLAAAELVSRLGGRERAELSTGSEALYAAAAPLVDTVDDTPRGQIIATAAPEVIEAVEVNQARRLFLLALVGVVLGGLVAAFTTRRLVAPIRALTTAAARVGRGDLATRAPVRTTDEVGVLGSTFNAMTSSIGEQSEALRQAASVESRLRASLEALTRSMSDGLVAVDPRGLVIASNPAAEELLGYASSDAVGRPLEDLMATRLRTDGRVWDLLGAPDSLGRGSVQLQLSSGNGKVVPTAVTAAPVTGADGAVLGRVLVMRDVTREVELERAKTEFLSNVSHELREPLAPIKAYASMLARREAAVPQAQRFAGEILDATERLERLVAMIVDFAALDSGRLAPRHDPTDVQVLTAELCRDWRVRVPGREFVADVPLRLPRVAADPGLLRRCLDELVDNAVKFSPDGQPIVVAARAVKEHVRLSVSDQGVGMDRETAEHMFSDFDQGDATETRQFGGLGLGLALVRRILEGMGVSAGVDSTLGRGTRVHLYLPVAPGLAYVQVPPPL